MMERFNNKILVLSYAFPPFAVAMAPCVAKAIASIENAGNAVDVLCADALFPSISKDESLLNYVTEHTSQIVRLPSEPTRRKPCIQYVQMLSSFLLSRVDRYFSKLAPSYPAHMMANFFYRLSYSVNYNIGRATNIDSFSASKKTATKALFAHLAATRYRAVLSFSPFHSINLVPLICKRRNGSFKWIAQFSDPWSGNPLEKSRMALFLAKWFEPKVIRSADFLIHNSQSALDSLVECYGQSLREKSMVIHHPFDASLYPQRPKQKNKKITLRHIGVLFARRTPEPLFAAINTLLNRRPELSDIIAVEFIGSIEKQMLETDAAKSLPSGMVVCVSSLTYTQSLEKMYDADIVVLIEADTKHNLFMPSKLSDYIGSRTPILGIVPMGPANKTLHQLGAWQAYPSETASIVDALEDIIDYVRKNADTTSWCVQSMRREFCMDYVGKQYQAILERFETR